MTIPGPPNRTAKDDLRILLWAMWALSMGLNVLIGVLALIDLRFAVIGDPTRYTDATPYVIMVTVMGLLSLPLHEYGKSYGERYMGSWRPDVNRPRWVRFLYLLMGACGLMLLAPGSPWSLLWLFVALGLTTVDLRRPY